jgi:predicted negative regulator of RcsB-dependent stress response
MRHTLTSLALLFAVCAPALAQEQPTIRYYDRAKKKEDKVTAAITQETPTKIVYKTSGNKTYEIPATDILDIVYDVRAGSRPDYRKALSNDEDVDKPGTEEQHAKAFKAALDGYKEIAPEFNPKENPTGYRHLQFRLARLLARRSEEDPTQLEPAIKALNAFLKDHSDGWQIGLAGQLLGKLQESNGDFAGAQKTYETMAKNTDLPKEMRLDFEMLEVRGLLRTSKHAQAEEKLKKMAVGLGPNDPNTVKLQVYQVECQVVAKKYEGAEAKLKAVLASDADPMIKALAANTLGDYYRETGKPEDAFWQYLWVDIVYNQDKHEQARALYHLSKLFDQVKGDAARAVACRERLLKDKEFSGLEYQKLAAKEK